MLLATIGKVWAFYYSLSYFFHNQQGGSPLGLWLLLGIQSAEAKSVVVGIRMIIILP